MRTKWLLIGVGLLTAVLAVAAIACDDDEDDDGDAVPTATVEGPEATATEEETTDADGQSSVTLSEVDGSGVTGSATLSDTAAGTEVVVTVSGGLEEGSHANHVHEGTCDAVGNIGEPLENLEAGSDGSAPATTTMTAAVFDHLLEEGHLVAVHALDGSIDACGDIS